MMPKFGLILVLLLAKSLAQEDPLPIFKVVGETMEMGFCFGVDYMTVHKINEGEKQLLWNSSNSGSSSEASKNRLNASSSFHGLLGLKIMDLNVSDSGVYLRECWLEGNVTISQTSYLYMCEKESPSEDVFLQNGGAMLVCDISYSEHESTSIKWFRDVYPRYKMSLFFDTERSQEPLEEDLNDALQVHDNGFSLYISEIGLEDNQNFYCLVMNKDQCKSLKKIHLPENNKPEMQPVYYGVGEKAALLCISEHLHQQQNYWTTPFGNVTPTTPHSQVYISNSEETRDHLLVIPSITLNHSGEYICMSNSVVLEYYITVCSALVSDNVQLYNGNKVILSCTLTQDLPVNILWYRRREITELIYDSGDPSIDMPVDMIGRTHIVESNASLIITELNQNDSGTYWCVVLLESVGQDTVDSLEDEEEEEEEDDNMDYSFEWLDQEENTETCIFKKVTQLEIPLISKSSKTESVSESSPVPYAIIGGVLGIVILGLIIVVVKMRAKRKTLHSTRAEPTAQQKDSAVSAPLMSL